MIDKDIEIVKELENHNFELVGISYRRKTAIGGEFNINAETRLITRVHPYSMREEPTMDEIEMLGIADMVEKVEE